MIEYDYYSPRINEHIKVEAPDIETLKDYIRIYSEWRDSLRCKCELWHRLQAFVEAYEETLDSLRRCENAL